VQDLWRVLVLGVVLLVSATIYFVALWASGLQFRQLLRR
jgi:hypothetical protein